MKKKNIKKEIVKMMEQGMDNQEIIQTLIDKTPDKESYIRGLLPIDDHESDSVTDTVAEEEAPKLTEAISKKLGIPNQESLVENAGTTLLKLSKEIESSSTEELEQGIAIAQGIIQLLSKAVELGVSTLESRNTSVADTVVEYTEGRPSYVADASRWKI